MINTGFNKEYYTNSSPLVSASIKISSKNILLSPQVIVVSPDGNTFIANLAGSATTQKKSYSKLVDAADAFLEDGTAPAQPTTFRWYLAGSSGKSRNAELHGITSDAIQVTSDKKPRFIKFSELQPGPVKFAKRYVAFTQNRKLEAKLVDIKKTFVYPEEEAWKSSAGKTVKAVFGSLEEDSLTLIVKKFAQKDQEFKLKLDKLDEASQARAKKWQEIMTKQNALVEAAKKEIGM